jgi:hypothetical protein
MMPMNGQNFYAILNTVLFWYEPVCPILHS